MTDLLAGLRRDLGGIVAFSDHEHHKPASFFENFSLDKLIESGYSAWCGYDLSDRENFLGGMAHNSYWHWLGRGISAVHGTSEVTAETWDAVSDVIAAHYAADAELHHAALWAHGFGKQIEDTFWDVGGHMGHLPNFSAAYRIDSYLFGIGPDATEPDTDEAPVWQKQGFAGGSLEDYIAHLRGVLSAAVGGGVFCALKCAVAYHRGLDFCPACFSDAAADFGQPLAVLSGDAKKNFGNVMMHVCADFAAELGIPFQIHTGLGQLAGTNPMALQPLIAAHPGTRFVCLHGGFPWVQEMAGVAHNHPNACCNLTWLPLISTAAATDALDLFLDAACDARAITWGSDCQAPEESVGALMAWREVLAQVLARRIGRGQLTLPRALALGEELLWNNGGFVYPLA